MGYVTDPVLRCPKCGEAIFSYRKEIKMCQQCFIAANAHRKFQRLTSKCNWRGILEWWQPAAINPPAMRMEP